MRVLLIMFALMGIVVGSWILEQMLQEVLKGARADVSFRAWFIYAVVFALVLARWRSSLMRQFWRIRAVESRTRKPDCGRDDQGAATIS